MELRVGNSNQPEISRLNKYIIEKTPKHNPHFFSPENSNLRLSLVQLKLANLLAKSIVESTRYRRLVMVTVKPRMKDLILTPLIQL
jgi:hypothetical protein